MGAASQERIRQLKIRNKKLGVFATVLLAMLSLSCIYLLFLQSDNFLLRKRLESLNASQSFDEKMEMDDTTQKILFPISDLVKTYNDSFSFGIMRPHYLILLQENITAQAIGWWLFTPFSLLPRMLEDATGVSFVLPVSLAVYAMFLGLLRMIRHWKGEYGWMAFVETSPRRWIKGFLFRSSILIFLSLERYAMDLLPSVLSPEWTERVYSISLIVFVLGCFMVSGTTYLALLWSLLVQMLIGLVPFFARSTFPLFCPWRSAELECTVSITRFVVVSEWCLLVWFLPRIRM